LLAWVPGITGITAIPAGTAEAGIVAGTVTTGAGVDSGETGIMTAGAIAMDGAAASFMAIAGFTVNMAFAMATSSAAIEAFAEIARASMATVADTVGADNALGFNNQTLASGLETRLA